MPEFLWCPECRRSFVDEGRIFFAQRCDDCSGLLEEEQQRPEVDFKEIDTGYEPEEEEEDNENETDDQEDSEHAEGDSEGE